MVRDYYNSLPGSFQEVSLVLNRLHNRQQFLIEGRIVYFRRNELSRVEHYRVKVRILLLLR
jgi:hypothetical protein